MNSSIQKFHFQGTTIAYKKFGNGPQMVLLFHGFGQDHSAFQPWGAFVPDKYSFIAIDLFFHGESLWPFDNKPITKRYWKDLMVGFLAELHVEKFSLVGYSIGCKFAMATLEKFYDRVNAICLVAPDGVESNYYYTLATYPSISRWLFRSIIKNPALFNIITATLLNLKLIDPLVLKFAKSQMESESKRKQVYYSWVVFRQLKFDTSKIASLINTHQIALQIFTGKSDRIIPPKLMNKLVSKVPQCNHTVLNCGHHKLIEESAKELRNISL